MRLHDRPALPGLRLLIDAESLSRRADALAAELARDYRGLDPLLLGVLKGSFIFLADLSRRMTPSPQVDFIAVRSYGLFGSEQQQVEVALEPRLSLRGRHVVVVEDIIDSGRSIQKVLEYVAGQEPASVRVCAMLVREGAREKGLQVDYGGFDVGPGWLVGYGLDLSEQHRVLPDVHVVEEECG